MAEIRRPTASPNPSLSRAILAGLDRKNEPSLQYEGSDRIRTSPLIRCPNLWA